MLAADLFTAFPWLGFTFFQRFGALGPCPRPSPGLDIEFPVQNECFGCGLAELFNFLSVLLGWPSCEPLFDDLGALFYVI